MVFQGPTSIAHNTKDYVNHVLTFKVTLQISDFDYEDCQPCNTNDVLSRSFVSFPFQEHS